MNGLPPIIDRCVNKSLRKRTTGNQQDFSGALSQELCARLASFCRLLYFLAFHWFRQTVLFLLHCTVCLFLKESPIGNYPKKSSLECSIHFICALARDQAHWSGIIMNKLRKFINRNASMHLTQETSPLFQDGIYP